ncbi:MAG: Mrp/NBP35 family ATP-binding protein [Spirochaetes bacterium]|nr:Mrp/NBP35 family ATP-binding protein [Spirochaetota bacterium]
MEQNNEELKKAMRIENLKKFKNKIVVMSGKGGVGKSTVSVNLAYGLTLSGFVTGIMDVDFHGPSVAKMTGIEKKQMIVEDQSGRPSPIKVINNLYVLSIASFMKSPDDSIIWRGPMKMGVINQFLEDIKWPELDYLIIDCPPGTGDEPLSIIQTIGDITGVVIVSTPQDIAFLDVRKSIDFANKLNVPILGLIENMAGFKCPKCGENIDIFKGGGAEKARKDFNIDILGQIPIDPEIVDSGDSGKPFIYFNSGNEAGKIFNDILEKIIGKTKMISDQ